MCISADHRTTANVLAHKAFTVSMATVEQLVACDYVGSESGNKAADKVPRAGRHTTRSEFVDAPLIGKLPMAVECRLVSYDPDKLRPIIFDPIHNTYRVLGEKVGNAFRDGAKLK